MAVQQETVFLVAGHAGNKKQLIFYTLCSSYYFFHCLKCSAQLPAFVLKHWEGFSLLCSFLLYNSSIHHSSGVSFLHITLHINNLCSFKSYFTEHSGHIFTQHNPNYFLFWIQNFNLLSHSCTFNWFEIGAFLSRQTVIFNPDLPEPESQ